MNAPYSIGRGRPGETNHHCRKRDVVEGSALSVDMRVRLDAEASSARLLNAMERARQVEPVKEPRRPLTFAEQIALLESGRAHIVEMPSLRHPCEDITLGGIPTRLMCP